MLTRGGGGGGGGVAGMDWVEVNAGGGGGGGEPTDSATANFSPSV